MRDRNNRVLILDHLRGEFAFEAERRVADGGREVEALDDIGALVALTEREGGLDDIRQAVMLEGG